MQSQGKVLLGATIVAVAIAFVFGFEWLELRYVEHTFRRSCAERHAPSICEAVVERHGAACEVEATRSVGVGMGRVGGGAGSGQAVVSTRAYGECLVRAASELGAR